MTDFASHVIIEFDFMGKTEKFNGYINYDGSDDGVDPRVREFFENAYDAGLKRYRETVRKYHEESDRREAERKERDELARLKSKYEVTG